ncbi:MAG: UDP-3-O-(3-hydroxymyristoyl)glucosamine N-acyltransferase [Acidobacteriaceae bacterium]
MKKVLNKQKLNSIPSLGYHSPMLLLQLAEILKAIPQNSAANPTLKRVAGAHDADNTSLVFAENEAMLLQALATAAAAILTTPSLAASISKPAKPILAVAQPRLAFAQAGLLLRNVPQESGIHPTAIVAPSAHIAASVSIGPYAVIGEHVHIGERTKIGAGSVLAEATLIGADCKIHPHVVLYSGVTLGDRVVLHAGCVLGSDGFGYVRDADTGAYTQFPQQGTLFIEDDVEIGANTTIDRGALEETRIARGTKLDNLVHIGHNVRIGSNVVIAAQTGISGSSTVGEGAILGGQVGVGEHAEIGPNVILGGGAGVLSRKKLRGPGMVFWGRPAQPLREYLKGLANLARLTRKAKD